jgi:RNA-directed DNA polymerase
VDGKTTRSIEAGQGVEAFLDKLRTQIRDRSFHPVPVRERMIPKANGKLRRLGIPTVADRVVQASLKLVLEPVFEADFLPCSYGFRPNRRAHDAIAETRYLASHGYEWVVEGDITACFDEIAHPALMERVRNRIGDKRVLSLVKAFLKSGILSRDGAFTDTRTGTPQGGILSPLLAKSHSRCWTSTSPRASGDQMAPPRIGAGDGAEDCPTTGWSGMRTTSSYSSSGAVNAEELRDEVAEELKPMGLRLSVEKTNITHIDEGLDFLGWRIQRHRKLGTDRQYIYIYTYPARKSVRSATGKVKELTGRQNVGLSLESLLHRLNSVLRGWCAYFRPGVSNVAFCYLSHYAWMRVTRWIRRKHPGITWKQLRRRYYGGGWWPVTEEAELFNPAKVSTTRYRYRGKRIPAAWPTTA